MMKASFRCTACGEPVALGRDGAVAEVKMHYVIPTAEETAAMRAENERARRLR